MSEPREYGWRAMREFIVVMAIAVTLAAAYAGSPLAWSLVLAGLIGALVLAVIGVVLLAAKIRHRQGRGEAVAATLLVMGSITIFFGLAVVNDGPPRTGGLIMAGGAVLCIVGFFLGDTWRR